MKRSDYVLARDAENNGFGALDLEILSGLDLSVDVIVPPAIGVGVAALSDMLIRRYSSAEGLRKYAPLLGGLIGAVASIPLKYWKGDAAMTSGAVAALLYGGWKFLTPMIENFGESMNVLPPAKIGGLTLERLNGLTLERVGNLPMLPAANSAMPASIRSTVDMSAYGRV
jgi:hypothetical protein